MKTIAISGTHGFIGGALAEDLKRRGHAVRPIERKMLESDASADLAHHLGGCSAVVHCAGLTPRARHLSDSDFDVANHQFTRNLGLASREAGVERLVFLSSIAVMAGHRGALAPEMPQRPLHAYGRSKAAGERALLEIAGLQTIVVRPPLVYGPQPKGDLGMLLKLCASPWPLPFGAIHNRRSMVGLTNLLDALHFLTVLAAPDIRPSAFHVSDGKDVSLRELVVILRQALDRPTRLINVPPALLRLPLRLAGMTKVADKLLGDLQVDISKLLALGWQPPVEPVHDLRRMAQSFMSEQKRS